MNTRTIIAAGSAARIFSGWGPKPTLDRPDDLGGLMQVMERHHGEVKTALTESRDALASTKTSVKELDARLADLEQKAARRGGSPGPSGMKTLGEHVVDNAGVKDWLSKGSTHKGTVQIQLDTKTVTSAPSTVGAGVSASSSLVVADRQPIVALPRRRLFVRDLFVPANTASNSIEFPQQKSFTNNAAAIAEGAAKPYSDVTFDLSSAPVRTIAHLIKASRQIMDDAPALQGFIDSQMRYGLSVVEEAQILFGNGAGQNILGLSAQAAPFVAPFAVPNPTMFDTLLQAVAQVENALYDATGIIVNSVDNRVMQATKDGIGRYFSGGPYEGVDLERIWNLPRVATPLMPRGQFMVGAFATAAQIFERLSIEVLISTENVDDFEKNLMTMRAEERIALAVYRPGAIVMGTFPQ